MTMIQHGTSGRTLNIEGAPTAAYNEEVQEAVRSVEVWQDECNGYSKSRSGRIVTQWPFSMSEYARRTRELHPAAFAAGPVA